MSDESRDAYIALLEAVEDAARGVRHARNDDDYGMAISDLREALDNLDAWRKANP